MRALLDTNVLLDLLLFRVPWWREADQLLDCHLAGVVDLFFTASLLTDVFYLVRKQAGRDRAFQVIEVCLDRLFCLPVGEDELRASLQLPGDDYEDRLQISCAASWSMDVVVTRDAVGFRQSSIRVATPSELLRELDQQHNASQR